MSVEVIGHTYEGREHRVVKICRDGCGAKNVMYVQGGIHAREWMSPAVVTYMINELTVNAANNTDMLDDLDWFIMPVANPDGYEYTKGQPLYDDLFSPPPLSRYWGPLSSRHIIKPPPPPA